MIWKALLHYELFMETRLYKFQMSFQLLSVEKTLIVEIVILYVSLTDWFTHISMCVCRLADSSCVHAMVKLYLVYFRWGLAELQCTCSGSHRLGHWQLCHSVITCPCYCSHFVTLASRFCVFTADEDLCWPVPPGSLHGVYHRSFHGVPSSCLPQTLSRDAALHLRDGVQKGMWTCTHRHSHTYTLLPEWPATGFIVIV